VKKQIGIWVSADVWQSYRDLCTVEKVRPAEAVESFLKLVNQSGSVHSVLARLDEAARPEGFEAYVRVVLKWLQGGQYFVQGPGETEVSTEFLLLEALKTIQDPTLRNEVEEALKKS
jgi:hypothetical protein